MKRWIIVAALVAVSLWTANLTLTLVGRGSPPTPNPQEYESQGNILALLFFSAAGRRVALSWLGVDVSTSAYKFQKTSQTSCW